ncbi:MAG: 50S ribosomal protein L19 [candidate division TM6 bacterium GW2011_GWF2_30_66]|jgi:large subunit ribosomal protein L19|nr:MAG: 50S ribosomal protein L19 [candidate division TM6 bacterium GW2011_GWF2_30_66]
MKAAKYTKETISELGVHDRNFPEFNVGDFIAVSLRVKEGDKERIQVFEGDVIAFNVHGISTTFTIRKIGANSVAVEKILPFYSPLIESIEFIRSGKKRRAKLYYLRKRVGKTARIQEKVLTKEQKELRAEKNAKKVNRASA